MSGDLHPAVQQHLNAHQVDYVVLRHSDFAGPIHGPSDFAAVLGYRVERICKTLLVRSRHEERYARVVCAATARMDLATVAELMDARRVRLATVEELATVLDYPSRGVSPLGAAVPVFVDQAIDTYETVLIGGGRVGCEIELSPAALVRATAAVVEPLTVSEVDA